MAAIAMPGFTVVQCKMCEHCGRNFVRDSIDSPSPYCPTCVAFFTVLDALSAERQNEPVIEKSRKKTGPKPTSVRFRGRELRAIQ
jgi:hypothetical protein